jgi:hypothetical protein
VEAEMDKMNDKMSEYEDLIHIIEATPKVPVPDHLTERVMSRLPELDQSVWAKLKHSLSNPSWGGIQYRWEQMPNVSNTRGCSFYFFITGFFYLIIGIIAIIGFKEISSRMAVAEWIGLQPYIALGMGIWLFALGIVLMIDGSVSIKAARYGTLFFIFFTVFNGILTQSCLHVPYAGVFVIGLVATSALMGVILALAVQKTDLRTV